MRSSHFILMQAALLTFTTAVADATEYLPLPQGMRWRYESAGGLAETKTVDGTAVIWGSATAIIRYSESESNEGLENYWTNGLDGDVFLWGFNRGFGVVYDPPITFVDAPLFLGKTWSTMTNVYSLPDTTFLFDALVTLEVMEVGIVSTPAGDFYSFGIGSSPSLPFSITGVADAVARGNNTDDWYSDGVGPVQYDTDDLYQLVEFGLPPTSAENTSWGAIKGLYR